MRETYVEAIAGVRSELAVVEKEILKHLDHLDHADTLKRLAEIRTALAGLAADLTKTCTC